MTREEIIRNLKYTMEKHRNDYVPTFGTDISAMCFDVLNVLKNCIEIPEEATNMDMLKIMLPNIQWDNECNGIIYGFKTNNRGLPMLGVDLAWGNEPYKKGEKK